MISDWDSKLKSVDIDISSYTMAMLKERHAMLSALRDAIFDEFESVGGSFVESGYYNIISRLDDIKHCTRRMIVKMMVEPIRICS